MTAIAKERVLLVDDEPQMLIALEDLLGEEFSVVATNSPVEALEFVRTNPDIAVVLTDQRMPQMTGDRLLGQMEGTSNAVGIMITGFADLSAVIRAVNDGRLFAYVTKPWDSTDLKAKVHQAADRFRLTQALAHERQLLHDLMNNAPDGIYFTDRDQKLLRVNDAYARSMGYPDGKAMISRPPERRGISTSQYVLERQVLASGEAATDRVRQCASGTRRGWVSETLAPIRDSTGSISGLIGIVRDVTSRVEIEQALQRREAEYRSQSRVLSSILDSLSEGVVVVDGAGRFIVCNDQASKLLGQELTAAHHVSEWSQICGMHHTGSHSPLGSATDPLSRALADQESSTLEIYVTNNAVKGSTLMVTARPLKAKRDDTSADRISGAVAVLRDVTRERELEGQVMHAQKMDAVGRLAGGVAHDFNNLLTIIVSYGDLLLRQFPEADEKRDDLNEMLDAAERAAKLTRQLLMFSRSNIVQTSPIQLNDVIEGVKKMLQRTLGEDVTLKADLSESTCKVAADVSQVEQVVLNLAVNARDAMPKGGLLTIKTSTVTSRELEGHVSSEETVARYALLTVSDTGTGMSKETMARIFEPFYTTKEVGKGTGIGLSTVYGIVTKNGGEIWVTSELGVGSTFCLAFPEAPDQVEAPLRRKSDPPKSAPGKRVLLVEDEEEVRRVTARILREEGYLVVECGSATAALQLTGPVDLLVTDVVMPEMNGVELAAQMTAQRPGLRTLFMSGYAGDHVEGLALIDEGAYLQKPLARKMLLERVARLLLRQTRE